MLDDDVSNLKTVKFFVQHFGCCIMLYSFGHVPCSSPEPRIDPRFLGNSMLENLRRRVLIAKNWLFEPFGACSLLVLVLHENQREDILSQGFPELFSPSVKRRALGSRLATVTQHCCIGACALGPLCCAPGAGAHKHRHIALKMLKKLRAFGQPVQHVPQHHAKMLQDVALKCCERLARP